MGERVGERGRNGHISIDANQEVRLQSAKRKERKNVAFALFSQARRGKKQRTHRQEKKYFTVRVKVCVKV